MEKSFLLYWYTVVVFLTQCIVDPILRTFEGSSRSASESGTQEEATVASFQSAQAQRLRIRQCAK